ncbi:N-acetylmuramoyl-L-alanine amidase, partial [Lysobacter sp. 2RAB21]
MREQNEDIRSRPLYANYLSASKLIHIHTNGPSATATGPRVLYYPGRTVDQQLATSILCGMKETIHALPAYANFTVPAAPTPSDGEGETRLAAMPSVIVEVAFHSNPTDAAALKDPAFRTAAMKGVEKGYRIHTQGKA